jgi:hypothetical protein
MTLQTISNGVLALFLIAAAVNLLLEGAIWLVRRKRSRLVEKINKLADYLKRL